jgi:hypothetical protein
VLAISLPLVASMGSFTVIQFTDRVFLANYSVDAIAAALPAGIASFTLISFFMGVANYTNVFVAPVALGGGLPVRCTQTGRGFTRQKYGGFTSHNPKCLFFLDFQGRIRVKFIIACYFKRRCFGEIGTSAFFNPRLRVLFFSLAAPGVKR